MKTTLSLTMSLKSSQQCGEKGIGGIYGSVHPAGNECLKLLPRRGLILLDTD